jgi:hypothetical protein
MQAPESRLGVRPGCRTGVPAMALRTYGDGVGWASCALEDVQQCPRPQLSLAFTFQLG